MKVMMSRKLGAAEWGDTGHGRYTSCLFNETSDTRNSSADEIATV